LVSSPSPVRDGYRSVIDLVTAALRDEILTQALKPNQRLRQEELATRLGVSRMPVRDALKRLEAERLVAITPQGAVAADMSPEVIWEDYVIRAALEGTATRLGVERMDERTLASLAMSLQRMKKAQRASDHDEELRGADEFHEALYAASGMPRLCEMIRTLRAGCERYRRAYLQVPGRSARSIERHAAVLEACRQGDADEAERLMKTSILENARVLLDSLRKA
jgi:DNA-binding GntR family transcriptional regulator